MVVSRRTDAFSLSHCSELNLMSILFPCFQTCLSSIESDIQSAASTTDSCASNISIDEPALGPKLPLSSEWLSDCTPSNDNGILADGISTDVNLLHRSNSLTTDGNSSPTSIMGDRHADFYSSSNVSGTPFDRNISIALEWSGLELANIDLVRTANPQRHVPSPSPSPTKVGHKASDVSSGSLRSKRKLGYVDCKEDGSLNLAPSGSPRDLTQSEYVTRSQVPTQAVSSSTPHKSSTSSEYVTVFNEVDNGSWDRSVDEEERSHKDEYISSRRRRRLNLIVPNPRKPRTADYMCSLCAEMYQVVVGDNPWWAVYSQQCPQCKQQQVPRIDINSASNAIELDPNVMALYGEGVEDSGDDECGGGSEEDEEVEKEDDDEAVAAAAQAELEDLRSDVHPFDGEGLLAAEQASKLLVLMCHARSCTGVHASPKHAEICKVRIPTKSFRSKTVSFLLISSSLALNYLPHRARST